MIYRRHYIANRQVLADSGEQTWDVRVRDPISALWVEFRATNGATHNVNNSLPEVIDKIELIDGSKVICSMSGVEAFALACYSLGKFPYHNFTEWPGDIPVIGIPIFFGRRFFDAQYAVDPTRFTNLQVRIKWNLANVRAVGATGYVTGTAYVTIFADLQEGGGAPQGYLLHKQIYAFTSAASGVVYIDLPVDYPYKGILIRAAKAATYLDALLTAVKVTCDADKFVPVDIRMSELMTSYPFGSPLFNYAHDFHLKNADTYYTILKREERPAVDVEDTADCVVGLFHVGYGEGNASVYVAGSASGSYRNISAHVSGYLPYGAWHLPFGNPEVVEDYLPAPSYKSVRLELTEGAASGACSVVTSQLVRG